MRGGISLFQFHDGSIKGTTLSIAVYFVIPFQFHDGSIKGANRPFQLSPSDCFNSTMVRLKAPLAVTVHVSPLAFQFHDGSIKGSK